MKDKIITLGFSFIIIGVGLISIIVKDINISFLERRTLTTKEDLDKDFFDNIEDYLSDQFPFRNDLLSINSYYERNILNNIEKNDVYLIDNVIYEKNYPLDIKSVNNFVNKMNFVSENLFEGKDIYYTVIPDKSYFLNNNKYLKIEYNKLIDLVSDINGDYIDIMSSFNVDDYYRTDIHIKQDSWLKIMSNLNNKLNFNYYPINYEVKSFAPFYGASYSKVLKNSTSEELEYLVSDIQNDLVINHLEFGAKNLYDLSKLGSVDSYDVFLSGPSSYIEIVNPNCINDKNLIVFRDSFGSSLVPLLTPYYSKITLIDLRYISFDLLKNYLNTSDNYDVLYLYSTLIINNSSILKVNYK